jgi:hypothetical protein
MIVIRGLFSGGFQRGFYPQLDGRGFCFVHCMDGVLINYWPNVLMFALRKRPRDDACAFRAA